MDDDVLAEVNTQAFSTELMTYAEERWFLEVSEADWLIARSVEGPLRSRPPSLLQECLDGPRILRQRFGCEALLADTIKGSFCFEF